MLLILIVASHQYVSLCQAVEADEPTNKESHQPAIEPTEQPEESPDIDLVEEDLALLDLEIPVVVTASRREQKASTIPYAVSVITHEDIRLAGAASISDALRLVPGLDVGSMMLHESAISIRGMHALLSPNLLVLIDGRQIFDSLFGGTAWECWPFQIDDIERIEIIRGPGGVTWGANAVNGVINIITRDPADDLGLTYTARGGSRGWVRQHLGYSAKEDKLRYRISSEYEGYDGYLGKGMPFAEIDDNLDLGRAAFHAVYDIDETRKMTFSLGAQYREGGYAPTPYYGVGTKGDTGNRSSYFLWKWERDVSPDERMEITAYVNDYQVDVTQPLQFGYHQFALQFGHSIKLSEQHSLSWGIDTRSDILSTGGSNPQMLSRDTASTAIIGFYVQDEWRFAPNWKLDLGGRVDYEFYGGFEPSARVALSYEVNDDSLIYGAVSSAFQMPAVGLRFLEMPMLNGFGHVTGNRDLAAARVLAYEIGYRGRISDSLDFSLAAYANSYTSIITMDPILGYVSPVELNADNRGDNLLYGIELDLRYRVSPQLTLLGNYTLQFMDWESQSPYHSTTLISPPKHKFMIGARYSPTEDLHLSSHLYYVDGVEYTDPVVPLRVAHQGSYLRLDARAEYEFCNDQASFAVGVRDLLDPSHPEASSVFYVPNEVPRMVFAEFRLSLP